VTQDREPSIVVGYDGSDQAADAVALGELLAEVLGATPEVVTVAGSPAASGLEELAVAHDAELLVVGSSHRGPVGRILPGSVGRRLLDGAPCPVAIAPRGFASEPRHIRAVTVGFDGTEGAVEAVEAAAALALAAGAMLRIVAVVDTFGHAYLGPERVRVIHAIREELGERLDAVLEIVPPDLDCEARLRSGPVTRTLLGEVAEGVDLLVLGSRSFGPLGSVLIGSVSSELVESSPVPLLIVPRGLRRPAFGRAGARNFAHTPEKE